MSSTTDNGSTDMNRFLQIHTLTSYPASLLNRDDAGFSKRMPFGGVTRTRVSSQCLKRHWRVFDGENSLKSLGPSSVRSRHTFDHLIAKVLEKEGVVKELAEAATRAVMEAVLGKSAKAKKADAAQNADGGDAKTNDASRSGLETGQITVLGKPEVEYLAAIAREACRATSDPAKVGKVVAEKLGRDEKRNLEQLRLAAGLDAAMFGRMVTSDILARGDAAVHVAHAITVHAEASESDYFSAVDELLRDGEDEELGSGHIGSNELTSGLFYGYVVLDLPLLVSNLEGGQKWKDADRGLAALVAERMVHMAATVSPGAKLGSTAPYAYAHAVMVEASNAQPRTLANAFLSPVRERPDLLAATYDALGAHVSDLDRMYGDPPARRVAALGPSKELIERVRAPGNDSLAGLAKWAGSIVTGD
ncbi:MAG: type I-E CRISPR-associated protein Cas7/Cse4/CasC [Anaeromyxobacteraceae bacterium]